ncbi:MAG: hypothetical protein R3F53_07600 [Gammaproteobacteria bacterium]
MILIVLSRLLNPIYKEAIYMSNERDRAWRRFKDSVNHNRDMGSAGKWKPEKKWKMVYLRSEKLTRAKQLGFEYPRKNVRQLLDKELPRDE